MGPLLIALAAVVAAYAYGRQAAHMAEKGLDVFGDPLKGFGVLDDSVKGSATKTETTPGTPEHTDKHAEASEDATAELARLRAKNADLIAERDGLLRDRDAASARVADLAEQLRIAIASGDSRAADIQRQLADARASFERKLADANAAKEAVIANANAAAAAADARAQAQAELLPRRGELTAQKNTLVAAMANLAAQIAAKVAERLTLAHGIPDYWTLTGWRITGDDNAGTERADTGGARVVAASSPEGAYIQSGRNQFAAGYPGGDQHADVRLISDDVGRSLARMQDITDELRSLTAQMNIAKAQLDAVSTELNTINAALSGNGGGLTRSASFLSDVLFQRH
jgi:predicted  nucleic acid-binding Zn-ribbon protein